MTSALLAALSAVLTFLFLMVCLGFGYIVWRDRRRFAFWWEMDVRGRADTIFQISLIGVICIAAYHRGIAAVSHANKHWGVGAASLQASLYLPVHIACVCGVLWWVAVEIFGPEVPHRAWLATVGIGAALGLTIFFTV